VGRKGGHELQCGKFKVMHISKNNPGNSYFMNEVTLGTTEEEKVVRIYVNSSLMPGVYCKRVANKATAVLRPVFRIRIQQLIKLAPKAQKNSYHLELFD
jgi:hypothetical protein